MKKATLFESLPDGHCRCRVCFRRCEIPPGGIGFCRTRLNREGEVFTLIYERVSSAAVDAIEKKPLYHFHPGSRVFSLGTIGCNLRCRHCQNWEIAYADAVAGAESLPLLTAEEAVRKAEAASCAGMAWTYNEPIIWLEYVIDCARLCRERGLYTVLVTNGFATPESIDAVGPLLDAYRVDIKGFSERSYRAIAGVRDFSPVLDCAVRAKERHGCHVECVTNLVPGVNDDEDELRALADWIVKELGREVPWHVTAFHPAARMTDVPATSVAALEDAMRIGREAGLEFVYIGNVPGHDSENTRCPDCGFTAVSRRGYTTDATGLADGGACSECGRALGFIGA